ncbi:hypothetical protein [Halalkalibacter alkalisediminis]|uniref:Uncharacterized protein n=1 Tax=Halalkalibacter alkalisediminis TaxID=935616 RepID=A0ABV6NAR0_9BACI|nr:hypothetical protein [Halalkalibacter alkalisediminis]
MPALQPGMGALPMLGVQRVEPLPHSNMNLIRNETTTKKPVR